MSDTTTGGAPVTTEGPQAPVKSLRRRVAELLGWTEIDENSVSGRAPSNYSRFPGELQPLPTCDTSLDAAFAGPVAFALSHELGFLLFDDDDDNPAEIRAVFSWGERVQDHCEAYARAGTTTEIAVAICEAFCQACARQPGRAGREGNGNVRVQSTA